jgi:hypothetical protein
MTLCELAEKHGTNKAEYGYTPIYEAMLKPRTINRILEIGIGAPGLSGGPSKHAASLKMWEEFFPLAEIFAMDVRTEILINQGRIHSLWADVGDSATLVHAAEMMGGNFDLIIDDAVHEPGPQINALLTLLPFMAPKGLYAIEDVANCDPREIIAALPPDEYEAGVFQCKLPLIFICRGRR